MKIRKTVLDFAEKMEEKLKDNNYKTGRIGCSVSI